MLQTELSVSLLQPKAVCLQTSTETLTARSFNLRHTNNHTENIYWTHVYWGRLLVHSQS